MNLDHSRVEMQTTGQLSIYLYYTRFGSSENSGQTSCLHQLKERYRPHHNLCSELEENHSSGKYPAHSR